MTAGSVAALIAAIEPPAKREEAAALDAIFRRVTGETPKLWGAGIIGYGEYRTTYDSGRDVHWMRSGFSPKKAKHSIYLQAAYSDAVAAEVQARLLARLGKHATGKSCLYVNRLADIDLSMLEDIIAADWQAMLRLHPKD